jgi:hypothetical protein
MWIAYRRHFGQDGHDVLVWQADKRSMDPAVPQSYIRCGRQWNTVRNSSARMRPAAKSKSRAGGVDVR